MALTATVEEMQIAHGRSEADKKMWVKFYKGALKNQQKSETEGRDIFDDVDYVEIVPPGDIGNIVRRPVWDEPGNPNSDTARWPEHWSRYKAGQQQDAVSGTPIDKLPGITEGQVKELKYFRIATIEQLSDLNDAHAQKFMGIQQLKKRAQQWLEAARGHAPLEKMRSELEQRDSVIAQQSALLKEMESRLASLERGETKRK